MKKTKQEIIDTLTNQFGVNYKRLQNKSKSKLDNARKRAHQEVDKTFDKLISEVENETATDVDGNLLFE